MYVWAAKRITRASRNGSSPMRTRVKLHESNIESLKKEITNIR